MFEGTPGSDTRTGSDVGQTRGTRLLCAGCRGFVTSDAERITVSDQHEHTFTNPAGYVYRVGCFAAAPGVRAVGIPSGEFTWFAGYMWRLDRCSACRYHLGWCFACRDDEFHALILARLVSDGAD